MGNWSIDFGNRGFVSNKVRIVIPEVEKLRSYGYTSSDFPDVKFAKNQSVINICPYNGKLELKYPAGNFRFKELYLIKAKSETLPQNMELRPLRLLGTAQLSYFIYMQTNGGYGLVFKYESNHKEPLYYYAEIRRG